MKLFDEKSEGIPEAMNELLLRISIVAVVLILPFTIYNFLENRCFLALSGSLIIAIFALSVWMMKRRSRHVSSLSLTLIPTTIAFLGYAVYEQGLIGVFWSFPAVLVCYFLLPEQRARLANIALLMVILPITILKLEPAMALRIVVTLGLVSLLTAIFVRVIADQRARMIDVNEGLRAEIEERIVAQRKLDEEIHRHKETARDLHWALRDACDANQAKSRFLSGMTHELRTPLNAIIGFGQMLDGRAGPLGEAQKAEYVGYILSSGDRLYTLINQVLDLAGIEAGKLGFNIEEVSVKSVAAHVEQELKLSAEQGGITLVNEVRPGGLPYIAADQSRVTQSVANLVSNAIKYNSEGGSVHISADLQDGFVRIQVSDTGNGIPADRHGEVFETFNRLEASGSRIEGSGVGLSLTKEFVEKMGGKIGFESVEGVGSTFWFELPVAEGQTLAATG